MSVKVGTAVLEIRSDVASVLSNLSRLEKELGGIRTTVSSTSSVLSTAGKALGAYFSVDAVVSAGKAVLDYAGRVSDLAGRLKVSTTAIQQWEGVFGPAGVSIDAVAKASGELSNRLVGGDKSATAALEKLGFNLDQLKAMRPEERFNAVADAVGQLQHDGERLYASKTLFGESGQELLAALDGNLQANIDKLTEMGVVIDEQTIAAADEFGDQLGFLGKQLMAIGAQILGPLLPALSALGNALSWLAREVIGPVLTVAVKDVMYYFAGLVEILGTLGATILEFGAKIPGVGKYLQQFGEWERTVAERARAIRQGLFEQKDATEQAGQAAATAAPKLVGLGGASDEASKQHKKQASELAKLKEKITDIDQAVGRGLFAPSAGDMGDRIADYMAGLEALTEAGDKAREIERQVAQGHSWDIGVQLDLDVERAQDELRRLEEIAGASLSGTFSAAIQNLPTLLSQAFTGGGGMRGAFEALGSQAGASIGRGLFNAGGLLNGLGNKLAGIFGASFGLALPGIGAALGALVGPALGKLWGALKRAFGGPSEEEVAGRDANRAFEQTIIDRLSASQRAEAGGERWRQVVIGVRDAYIAAGRSAADAEAVVRRLWEAEARGPEAVAAVRREIEEIIAQAGRAAEAADASADAAIAAQQRQADDMTARLEQLRSERDNLAQSYANEAWEEEMGVEERAARDAVAALDDQIAQQQASFDEATRAIGESLETAITEATPDRITVPIEWAPMPFPGVEGPEMPIVPMAKGGFGEVTRPTLFLAGEAGREQVAFSGANRVFQQTAALASAAGVQVGSVTVTVYPQPNEDLRTLAENIKTIMRNDAEVYVGIGNIAERRVGRS